MKANEDGPVESWTLHRTLRRMAGLGFHIQVLAGACQMARRGRVFKKCNSSSSWPGGKFPRVRDCGNECGATERCNRATDRGARSRPLAARRDQRKCSRRRAHTELLARASCVGATGARVLRRSCFQCHARTERIRSVARPILAIRDSSQFAR